MRHNTSASTPNASATPTFTLTFTRDYDYLGSLIFQKGDTITGHIEADGSVPDPKVCSNILSTEEFLDLCAYFGDFINFNHPEYY